MRCPRHLSRRANLDLFRREHPMVANPVKVLRWTLQGVANRGCNPSILFQQEIYLGDLIWHVAFAEQHGLIQRVSC